MPSVNRKSQELSDNFALRFRLLMSYHNLTLKQIATYTDNAISTVGTWKNGRLPASMETIERLSEIFHVSVEYLLEGKAKVAPHPDLVNADRILRDIDDLLRELDDDLGVREPLIEFDVGGESEREGGEPRRVSEQEREQLRGRLSGKQTRLLRHKNEVYFKEYLDKAEKHPGGLEHTWIQLRREFPLSLWDEMR